METTELREQVTVTLTVGEIEVKLTGPETFVRSEIERLATLLLGQRQAGAHQESRAAVEVDEEQMSEQELITAKRPSGHLETVTVLAFALKYKTGLKEFTEDDMKRAYLRARQRPPKVVGQALRDAKKNCDFIEYGSTRGTYKISDHGERTVRFDLPRAETP